MAGRERDAGRRAGSLELAGAGLLYALLTAVLAWPLSAAPATRAMALSADTRLFLWTLSWDVHALLTRPLRLFDANIFHPEPRTLAYSEHLLGSALLSAPALLATGNPVLAMNVVVLVSCVLCGLGAYVLARELRASAGAAFAAGVVYAFAAPRFVRLAQVHLATVQWIPFALAFFHRYARTRRRRDLVLALVFFTLQALTSGHGGLFLALALLALAVYLWALRALPSPWRMLRDLGFAGLLLVALNAAFVVPYARAQKDVGLHRTIGAVYDWNPNAASFLASPAHAQQALLSYVPPLAAAVEKASAYMFPGWLPLLLAVVAFRRRSGGEAVPESRAAPAAPPRWLWLLDGLVALAAAMALVIHVSGGIDWRIAGVSLTARTASRAFAVFVALALLRLALARLRPLALAPALARARDAWRRFAEARTGTDGAFYLVLLVLSVWASLGPGYVLYTTLYRLLPGFDLVRVPSRLVTLSLLAVAVLAALGLDRLLARLSSRGRLLGAAAAAALVSAELAMAPLDAREYPVELPEIDRVLAARPKPFAAVELPVADPADAAGSARLHSRYMLHSMAHWQPIVNGYSGIVPPRHERLFRMLTAFPDTASLAELEAIGVGYAVLHRELYDEAQWRAALARAEAMGARLKLEAETADGRLYSLPFARPRR
jgi:hypothetical protein